MHLPPPKFATDRDAGRPTLGGRQDAFGKIWLGSAFMPAQRLIADVAGELNEQGRPRHPLVVVTEPRQAGKSHLAMAQIGERCFSRPGFRAWYTAQTGGDARDQFVKFDEEVVKGQPLEAVVTTLTGAGREVMRFPNMSQLRPHPPTEEKLHGKQSDRNDIDEAWAFDLDQGRALMQAIGPTQLTRPGAQTFIWSAGGTADSTWLAQLVARGRAGDPDICYFEWGIPDDADAEDLEVIAQHHPAFGHTITMDSLKALRANFGDDAAGWARAAGNRWTEIIGGAISQAAWERVRYGDAVPDDAPVGYGTARAADGSEVAIVAAVDLGDCVVVEVIDVVRPFGAAEIVNTLTADGPLAIDRAGPNAGLADALDQLDRPLTDMTTRQASAAVQNMLDGMESRSIRFRRHPSLDGAAKVAATRPSGDGGKLWARLAAGASIAALEAATQAVWAVTHREAPAPEPRIYVPGMAS